MTALEDYYNKFNEDKRLLSRHGKTEYLLTMELIEKFLPKAGGRILDLGAATGAYTLPLAERGYDLTAVEPVQHNLGRLKQKAARQLGSEARVSAMKGDARNLKKLDDGQFDLVLMLGPMYHLTKEEDRISAMKEAIRVAKPGAPILVAYVGNDYAVLVHGFRDKNILEEKERLTADFQIQPLEEDLYYYARLSEINARNEQLGLTRLDLISPDGPANYMRPALNALSEEEFQLFLDYQRANCRRSDLMGAGGHLVDVVVKN